MSCWSPLSSSMLSQRVYSPTVSRSSARIGVCVVALDFEQISWILFYKFSARKKMVANIWYMIWNPSAGFLCKDFSSCVGSATSFFFTAFIARIYRSIYDPFWYFSNVLCLTRQTPNYLVPYIRICVDGATYQKRCEHWNSGKDAPTGQKCHILHQ